MTDQNQRALDRGQPSDEAENIRRWSPGNRQSARDGGANAIASITGSFWVALVALVGVIVVGILSGYVLGVGEARDEDVDARLGVMGSRISVLEYDSARMCAQLLEAELIEVCH